jgi:uncharacterized protein (DUF433 family)
MSDDNVRGPWLEKPVPLANDDLRIVVPLFTFSEVGQYIRVPAATVRNWARGYDYPTRRGIGHSGGLIRVLPSSGRQPRVPFMGLAEALVIAAFRQDKKIPMDKVRAGLKAIQKEVGVDYALANKMVYTDGASILLAYAKKSGDDEIRALVEPATGQGLFTEAVRQYLTLITYGEDRWAESIELPGFAKTRVVVDTRRNFGQPMLENHRLRVVDITDRFFYGNDDPPEIAADLEIEEREVWDVIRATRRTAAA